MKYRLAKRNETTTPRYEVSGTVQVFTRSHKGLEAAIELADSLETFVVAFNADCSTETVWTHPKLQAASDKERCAYYERGTFHGD